MESNYLDSIVALIKKEKVGIFPCDTILGLVGLPTQFVVDQIRQIKKRSRDKPLLMLLPNIESVTDWVAPLSDSQKKFVDLHWPGPVTVILKKSHKVGNFIVGGLPNIAIRVPKFKPLNELLNALNMPLVSTSVNISEKKFAHTVSDIDPSIKENVAFIVSDVKPLHDEPSTIVDFTKQEPVIVRKGVLSL